MSPLVKMVVKMMDDDPDSWTPVATRLYRHKSRVLVCYRSGFEGKDVPLNWASMRALRKAIMRLREHHTNKARQKTKAKQEAAEAAVWESLISGKPSKSDLFPLSKKQLTASTVLEEYLATSTKNKEIAEAFEKAIKNLRATNG